MPTFLEFAMGGFACIVLIGACLGARDAIAKKSAYRQWLDKAKRESVVPLKTDFD